MQRGRGNDWFSAFLDTAARLSLDSVSGLDADPPQIRFAAASEDGSANMLSIRNALVETGFIEVRAIQMYDPRVLLEGDGRVVISLTRGPMGRPPVLESGFSGGDYYIAYRYSESWVGLIVQPGNVCYVPWQEFSEEAMGMPFLVLSPTPNNSLNPDGPDGPRD
jgi:hypothetical protein